MAPKYDVKRELKHCYAPTNRSWELVEVPRLRYLAADGHGDPNTADAYGEVVAALYATAYTAKFASKKERGRDFVVGPLEGLWWSADMDDFLARRKDSWSWRMLINLPGWITDEQVEQAKAVAIAKKGLPAIDLVRPVELDEGTCAQKLHVGSYDDETPAMVELHDEWLPAHDLAEAGLHHEIYLSDPRRTDEAKLKTILRQPVRQKVRG